MTKTVREVKGKSRLDLLSPIAASEQAKAADHGNRKPGRGPWNWRTKQVKASDQLGAALRHIAKLQAREDIDPKSLAHHAGHVMQRMAIFIEAQAFGTLIDDRPPAQMGGLHFLNIYGAEKILDAMRLPAVSDEFLRRNLPPKVAARFITARSKKVTRAKKKATRK